HQPALPLIEQRQGLGEEPLQVLFVDLHDEILHRATSSDADPNHVSNIMTKLHAAGRAEAMARARDAGLGKTQFESPYSP
ncbi:MAG: hypothetical protein ACR2HY_07545, partial [Acidimicrobiales bacterium]